VVFDSQPWVYDEGFINSMTTAVQQALTQLGSGELSPARVRRYAEGRFDIQRMADHYLQALGLPLSSSSTQQTH
jgi:hypothetical protein